MVFDILKSVLAGDIALADQMLEDKPAGTLNKESY